MGLPYHEHGDIAIEMLPLMLVPRMAFSHMVKPETAPTKQNYLFMDFLDGKFFLDYAEAK